MTAPATTGRELTTRTVALVGNPNTGKSTLFGVLAGVHQRVGNYPGVTVEKKLGQMTHGGRRWTLVDLPGTYSLAPRSLDEMVAVDVLLGRQVDAPVPDVVVCVVDANNLERNLYLVSQVLELGRPTVIALTMTDVAQSRGLTLDLEKLEAQLGVRVVPVLAHKRKGLDALKTAIEATEVSHAGPPESPFAPAFQAEVADLERVLESHPARGDARFAGKLPRYLVERLLLDTGGYIEGHLLTSDDTAVREAVIASRKRLAAGGMPVPAVEAMARYGWVGKVVDGVITRPAEPPKLLSDKIDALLTHRFWGTATLALVMLVIFNAVFSWSEVPMGWIDAAMGGLAGLVERFVPEGALRSLLVDGVVAGVGGIVVFLPQIFILFFFLAILEDCGYLARAAYLMDRLMTRVGLSGKSFIPLLSSFACAIPGIMATRVIENRRDRLTTILVAPLMSCSARLPVYTLLIAAFVPARAIAGGLLGLQGLTMFAMYVVGIVVAAVVALLLKRTLLKGQTPPFVMELPPYKWPSPRVVIYRMLERGWAFIQRAGTVILAVSVVMWALLNYPKPAPEATAPIETEIARLDEEIGRADGESRDELEARKAEAENRLTGLAQRSSLLGRAGRLIEPVVRPLGWDWRIGSAVIASFPAREVVVATMGVIFDVGADVEEDEGQSRLQSALKQATWEGSSRTLFTLPVALSVMVFFALCAQCVSTLAIIRRETNSWGWPAFCFAYMTGLAYLGAFVVFRVGTWLGW